MPLFSILSSQTVNKYQDRKKAYMGLYEVLKDRKKCTNLKADTLNFLL